MKFLLSFLLLSVAAIAQTTVTGTIIDPNGNSYANGTAAAYTVATSGQPTTSTSPVALNTAGSFTLSLNANTYVFTICAPPVGLGPTQNPTPTQVCFTSSPIAISGPSQDVSTQLNAVAKVIGPNRNITGNAVAPVSRASIQAGATADVQISNAIAALSGGSGTIWADYSTAQTWASCPTWGSGNVNLTLYAVTYTVAVNCTIPKNVHVIHALGSLLSPATGTVITYLAFPNAGAYKIFDNALSGQGTIDFTGNSYAFIVRPEWWGACSACTATTNTSAIQASVWGAFGCGPDACRVNGSNLAQYNKPLEFCSLFAINGEIQFYHVNNFQIRGCGKSASGIVQSATNKRTIDGQNIAYGTIHDLTFSSSVSSASGTPLVDIDNDHTHGADLSPQEITFRDVVFFGNFQTDVGVLIAKHGGDAQGDNIRCQYCLLQGFTGAGWQIGGNNTGRNVGRFYALNAIKQQINGGDCQSSPLYCIAVYGGSIEVDGMSMEAEAGNFGTQTGADVYCESALDRCIVRNIRSEDHQLAWGNVLAVEHSKTIFQAGPWYGTGFNFPGFSPALGTFFSGTAYGGDGKYYKTTSTGTFGGLTLTSATSGTINSITVSGASFTVNVFAGQQATIYSGTGIGQLCQIASNTATTISCSGNWTTNYYQSAIVAADNTSQFVVEPYWAGHPTSNGTVSFAVFDFPVIQGALGTGCNDCIIQDVEAAAGTVQVGGLSRVDGLRVSRSDWTGNAPFGDSLVFGRFKNVRVDLFASNNQLTFTGSGTAKYRPWTFSSSYSGQALGLPDWEYRGTQPICWEYGQNGGGTMANDVCIGVRTDNASTSSVGRAVLGIIGTVGPVTPFGTNQAGVDLPISGGLSTGNGAVGGISFRLGSVGASGNQVNDSTEVSRIDANGLKLPSFTFANLPSAGNGYLVFCSDCKNVTDDTTGTFDSVAASGGHGTNVLRENGAWRVH